MNVIHFCVVMAICLSGVVVVCRGGGSGLCGWIEKALLNMMFRIVSSLLYSSSCMLYVFSLLYMNLMATYLCWAGWLEDYEMIMSVKVGFLYMDVFQLMGVLWMVMSR